MYLKIAGFMALTAVVSKLLLFLANVSQQNMALLTIFINLLIVLVGSFFAVRSYKISNPGSELKSQVKYGMKATTLFALILSAFVLVYYEFIDTHYLSNMIEERVAMAEEQKVLHPEIDVAQVRHVGEMMFSPRTHATLTLFGLTAIGALYSLIIAVLMRRLPGFR